MHLLYRQEEEKHTRGVKPSGWGIFGFFLNALNRNSVVFPIEAFRIHLRNFFSRLGFVFRFDGHIRFPGLGDFNPIAFRSISLMGKRVASVGFPNMTWGSSSPKQSGQTHFKKLSRRTWPVELSVPQRAQTGTAFCAVRSFTDATNWSHWHSNRSLSASYRRRRRRSLPLPSTRAQSGLPPVEVQVQPQAPLGPAGGTRR
jgi:hypothetical protein